MNSAIASSLQSHFGFTNFRHGQAEAIQSLLDGKHTLVVMPTGSGKSLVFQLTALHLPGVTLVISPLIALMKDQVDSLERRGIPATFVNSTLATNEQSRRLRNLAEGKYRMVYVAPERLRSLQFIDAFRNQRISLLAVDEAHCISEWGHDFRPDYLHIAKFRSALGNPLTVALTATATPQVQDDIVRLLGLTEARRIVTGFNRPNLAFEVQYINSLPSRLKLLHVLLSDTTIDSQQAGATIIYTGTRRDAEEVAEFINSVIGLKADYYHAGLSPDERTQIQDLFMAGDLQVVVATNAFGMGIDRPDVRHVVHYSLPGSLEAYYQEAGRAGRDGLPARATLLYSPDDRALQEWFIEASAITLDDLRLLYEAMKPASDQKEPITYSDLSCLIGWHEVKVRVGLAELEHAGALEHIGDDRTGLRVQLLRWNASEIQSIINQHRQHQQYRREQLNRVIAYAESNNCRRKILLSHFGDQGPAEAELCCDNCQANQQPQTETHQPGKFSQSDHVPLLLLDTVRLLKNGVGREKVAKILKGSQAKDITRFGYDKNPYYGRLVVYQRDEIVAMIDQLTGLGYLKVVGGEYPVVRLTPRGEAAIRNKTNVPIKLPHQKSSQSIERKKAERQAGGTLEYTAQLLSEGLSVERVADQRGLAITTIYSHVAKLISAGRVSVAAVVDDELRQIIESAIRQVASVEYLYPIKILLPDDIDYNVIRCVVEDWKLTVEGRAVQKGHLSCSHDLGGNPELSSSHDPNRNSGAMTTNSPPQVDSLSIDPVEAFLSRPHPRQLSGPWSTGWALGFHSQFTGADWSRSGTGELAYRLKYQNDISVLPELVRQASDLISSHPELAEVDAIIPVPPSTQRPNDPVRSFATALAQQLDLPLLPVLIKARQTAPQKEMQTLAQKHVNVDGAFDLKSPIKGKRLLVIDDLYDSGATLEEITRLLVRAGAAKVNILTMTRTIHSDA